LLQAIEEAGSTDPEAVIAALEGMDYAGALGNIWFEYGSGNPVPDDQPAWMWHQWPTPTVMILQYTEVGQTVDEATVVYPPERATGDLYTAPPG
jgi:branched-chain amino acid transport system substrate-binding protein